VSSLGRWTPKVQALSAAASEQAMPYEKEMLGFSYDDPGLRAKLLDTLVRQIFLHGVEV
jgi:hypothetical protein